MVSRKTSATIVTFVGQRHFRCPYKHEAQASVFERNVLTRLRFVLVFSQVHTKVALSS
jgi:hypothetical protein